MRLKTMLAACLVFAGIAAGAALAYAWHPEIAPVTPPARASFDAMLVAKGRTLALIGDCKTCHTAPSGRVFAGGLAMPTPFGKIYSTNITPDRETGIGTWSQDAFRRAMREGVDRHGRHLYPAFPYDHFTLTNDEDIEALYAFFMTREPVNAKAPDNELPFPINVRLVLAGWKLLFFSPEKLAPVPGKSEAWNRGRYLVEGLGHCGACHTSRNLMGAEQRSRGFNGGQAEGWRAFALGRDSKAPRAWTAEALEQYLAEGFDPDHGTARGPMAPVIENLAQVPRQEVAAMATYLASLAPVDGLPQVQARPVDATPISPQSTGWQTATPSLPVKTGPQLFAGACASCHGGGRMPPLGGVVLQISTAVGGESPENLLNLILDGIPASKGVPGPVMPGFTAAMSNDQIVSLVRYLRVDVAGQPEWTDLEEAVHRARSARTSGAK